MYIIDIHNKFIINYNMKLKYFIYIALLSLVINQDRTTLFSTGSEEPDPSWGGYPIHYTENEIYGAADRFYLGNEYVLERAYVYLSYSPEDMFDLQSVEVQLRYRSQPTNAKLTPTQPTEYDLTNSRPYRCELVFENEQFSITPGQAAVFYYGDVLLGGGIIIKD